MADPHGREKGELVDGHRHHRHPRMAPRRDGSGEVHPLDDASAEGRPQVVGVGRHDELGHLHSAR